MHKSADIFLERTNNITPDIAVILGSGLTNFFDEKNITNLKLQSLAGILNAQKINNEIISVNMGRLSHHWEDIPLTREVDTLNMPIQLENFTSGVAVNVGNPHIVFFIDNLDKVDMNKIGPKIEHNSLFPERINVEICQILDKNKIRSKIWERGVGLTLACGSGACAVLVAACKEKLTGNKAKVLLDGGSLEICWNYSSDKHVIMSGPTSVSFLGDFSSLGDMK